MQAQAVLFKRLQRFGDGRLGGDTLAVVGGDERLHAGEDLGGIHLQSQLVPQIVGDGGVVHRRDGAEDVGGIGDSVFVQKVIDAIRPHRHGVDERAVQIENTVGLFVKSHRFYLFMNIFSF